jgi:RLL motif-containing protein 1
MAEALGGAGGGEGDGGAAGLAGRLEACRKAVKRRQAAAAAAAAAAGGGGAVDVEALPLGFAMAAGDGAPALERAAKVLRALYIQDLRDLQTQVDRLVVQAQEYTANPKTDSSLGRTGR